MGTVVYAKQLKWSFRLLFFFNDTATTEIYTLSLHDALPIFAFEVDLMLLSRELGDAFVYLVVAHEWAHSVVSDRKSTRLNSSHANISYAVFCLKKKKPSDELHVTSLLYMISRFVVLCHILAL